MTMRLDDKIPERVAVGMSAEISPAVVDGTRMLFALLSEYDLPATVLVGQESLEELSEAGLAFRALLPQRPPQAELAYISPFRDRNSGPAGFYKEFTASLKALERISRKGDGRGYMPSTFEAQHGHIRGILEDRFKYVLCEEDDDAARFSVPNMRFGTVQEQESQLASDIFSADKAAYNALDTASWMHLAALKDWRRLRENFKEDVEALLQSAHLLAERVAQPEYKFPPRIYGVSLLPYLRAYARFPDQTIPGIRQLFGQLRQMRVRGEAEPITLGDYVTKYLRPEAA